MNPYKPDKVEWITFFVIAPLLVIIMNRLLFGDAYLNSNVLLKSYSFLSIYIFISWYLHVTVMHILRIKYPTFDQTRERITILFLSHIFLTSSSLFMIFWTYDYFNFLGYVIDYGVTKWCLVIGIAVTLLATSTWEGTYIYKLWKESLHEKEILQKMNLQSEFDALKSQVNPHFLFNSLNSLSSLIQENPAHAEKFLDEMSKVYRYILRNNQMQLIDLETELKFLQSYYHLLKTRHNEGLFLNIDIKEKITDWFLPPLTLQLLLENAVKHNIVQKEQPLLVSIGLTNDDWIEVRNNIQKKTVKVPSTRLGLLNISNKYKLLNMPDIKIDDGVDEFRVCVPLIK